MKIFFNQNMRPNLPIEEELETPCLKNDIQKTRYALEIAYAGFDNAVEPELIDCYIYEINSLQKRYNYLLAISANQPSASLERLHQKSSIRALVSHVFS